jgi:hypothetical protein
MNKDTDEIVGPLLQRRPYEEPSPDLALRIIMAATQVPQRHSEWTGLWIVRFFETLLPRPLPAYVLASTLIVGFLLGFTGPVANVLTEDEQETAYVQDFLYESGAAL